MNVSGPLKIIIQKYLFILVIVPTYCSFIDGIIQPVLFFFLRTFGEVLGTTVKWLEKK